MTPCTYAILRVIWALQLWSPDSSLPPSHRLALYTPVAEAACAATQDRTERAFLLTQAEAETHFAAYVLEDRCHEGPVGARCDAGRAWGGWQVHKWCARAWDVSLPLVERHAEAAQCALRGWRRGLTWWGPAGGFQAQRHSGPPRAWAIRRAERMQQVRRLVP